MSINLRADIRRARAQVWFDYAVNPAHASQMAQYFGGDGRVPTYADVLQVFGAEAAKAWEDAKKVRARFFRAVLEGV